jgi:hypothetical protein
MLCALGNVAHEALSDLRYGLPSLKKSRDLNNGRFLPLCALQQMLLPLQERFAFRFRGQLALQPLSYGRPFERMYGGAYLWQRDELFRARQYEFVGT